MVSFKRRLPSDHRLWMVKRTRVSEGTDSKHIRWLCELIELSTEETIESSSQLLTLCGYMITDRLLGVDLNASLSDVSGGNGNVVTQFIRSFPKHDSKELVVKVLRHFNQSVNNNPLDPRIHHLVNLYCIAFGEEVPKSPFKYIMRYGEIKRDYLS